MTSHAMVASAVRFKRRKEEGSALRHSQVVMPLAYAICSAIVGTQSVVQAKCLSELLTMTFQGENQMVRAGGAVVLLAVGITRVAVFLR